MHLNDHHYKPFNNNVAVAAAAAAVNTLISGNNINANDAFKDHYYRSNQHQFVISHLQSSTGNCFDTSYKL